VPKPRRAGATCGWATSSGAQRVVDTLAETKSGGLRRKEVVANAKQIADAIEPYYGKAASEKLFGLLAGHYGGQTVSRARQQAKQDAAVKNLTAMRPRSPIPERANPNLPFDTLNACCSRTAASHAGDPATARQAVCEEARTWKR